MIPARRKILFVAIDALFLPKITESETIPRARLPPYNGVLLKRNSRFGPSPTFPIKDWKRFIGLFPGIFFVLPRNSAILPPSATGRGMSSHWTIDVLPMIFVLLWDILSTCYVARSLFYASNMHKKFCFYILLHFYYTLIKKFVGLLKLNFWASTQI